ncbi:ZmpA/ZmpB/ZmpC family metallo-endopeptidase-related protein [Haloferax marisrubri]|uniref:ZmpA/ZmpB/ZmpC family metallo-endopeptidase-related protein n=1 Tax=Haloferax marisrubri TaxID=1544719 RepID=UPI000A64D1A7|nr:ZmpA/ZmpB/ZmpC family metallo-endopeptidase-related protein [Haloferax marisrubri]
MGHKLTQTTIVLLLCGLLATAPIAGATTVAHEVQPTGQSSLETTETTLAISGNGTEVNPYVITNASGLTAIRDDLDAHYVLGSDIDATETATWNNGSGFEPIGTFSTPFTGTIDGENHTIEGLTIDRPSTSGVALVGYASESSITDLQLTDVAITGDFTTAALVGSATDTVVREVTVSGSISGSGTVAGMVATTDGGTVEHVDATVTVESPGSAGGLVAENEGTVSNVVVSGHVTGGTYVGGIAAQNPGTIERAAVNATVVGTTDDTSVATGGLVGYNSGNITATHAHGRVSGTNYVGGLVGSSNYESGVVADSYATANVSGESTVGGLVGGLYYGSSVIGSYWNEQTSGQPTSAAAGNGSVGFSTAAMTGEAATTNLTALDFAETWQVESGAYPDLVGVRGDEYSASTATDEPTPLGLNATTELVDSDLVLTVTANDSLDSLEAVLASSSTVYQETITLDAFSETQNGSTYVYTTRYVDTAAGEYTLDVSASDETGAQTTLNRSLTVGDETTAPTVDLEIAVVDDPLGPNSTTTAELVARNVSSDIGAYEATISVPEASGVTITAVNATGSPAFANTTYSRNNTTARVSVVGRTPTESESPTLATITLESGTTIDEGDTVVSVSDANVSTEGGDEITVTSMTGDTVPLAALDPVGDFESPPTDPDGDGVYEDVNGDGNVTVSDVQALFTHRDSEAVTEQSERFDVTGNGVFNIVDVQRLFYTTTT